MPLLELAAAVAGSISLAMCAQHAQGVS